MIAEDQNGFKARVIGNVRAGLPRKPPGRRGSPEIQKAAEIYIRVYKSRDKKGNWREIGKQVIPEYAKLTPSMQRLHQISLRANVHSFLYEDRSRRKRSKEVP